MSIADNSELNTQHSTLFFTRNPLLLFVIGVVVALMAALLVLIIALNPPGSDISQLIVFLLSSSGATLLAAYIVYRRGLARWFRSLRWALLATVVLTVGLVFFNVWITAQLMFLNEHDLWLTTALLVFAGVTAIAFGLFIADTITERIRLLGRAAEQLGGGELATRVTVAGNDELAELARTFNMMAHSLEEVDAQKRALEQTRRNLIAWVSHDLRTPLASMRVMIEALADGVVSEPGDVARYLGNTQAEIEHLSHLIDDLFDLAKLDVGQLELAREWTSLRDLLSDTLGSIRPQAVAHGLTLDADVGADLDPVYCAPDKIQRVLYNLLDNAIAHTPTGGAIMLRAVAQPDRVRISVHNTGSHIPADDLPRVFESFYRSQPAQARQERDRRGAGLGLAIARGFVEAHGGTIRVESAPGTGTTFTFTLPRQ